jgi:three-Cys-motif partner protein
MVLSDSDPKKWVLKEHTRVKHEILDKYLTPWIYKLSSAYNTLIYIDGFAGRGDYYNDAGEIADIGSPIIAMRKAQEHKDKVPKFHCVFIEKDRDNFYNLRSVIKREEKSSPHPILHCENGDFESEITKLLDKFKDTLPPTFCFIDPFGFDAPFSVIKRLMAIPRTEVFFTFMFRDINRFISSDRHSSALTELFGTESWNECNNKGTESDFTKEKCIINLYQSQLHQEASIKYTMPFMVKMPDKRQIVYYLIHATNSFDGFKIMKDIMSNRSSGESFGYLGPEDGQTSLGNFDLGPLQDYLLRTYCGKTISFNSLVIQSYPVEEVIRFVEKNYREKLKEMEKEGIISVKRVTSKTNRGLGGIDLITFPASN